LEKSFTGEMKRVFALFLIFGAGSIVCSSQSLIRLNILNRYAKPLYRSPTKEELKKVSPDKDLIEKYRELLKDSRAGLTTLVADAGCAENTNVVSAEKECIKYSMPGGGSSFSFRVRNYRIARLADITFTRDSFQATGALLHGIFVNLGDVKVDRVSINTKGMRVLRQFRPTSSFRNAKKTDEVLSRGFVHKGFVYRRALYIKENTTFALRSIAYRGTLYRAIGGATYNELDFDKRRDVIVVFRIVRVDKEGRITILWKELQNQKSPKLLRGTTKDSK